MDIENNSFIFEQDNLEKVSVKYKYSKLILIQVLYNGYHNVCFFGKIVAHLIS